MTDKNSGLQTSLTKHGRSIRSSRTFLLQPVDKPNGVRDVVVNLSAWDYGKTGRSKGLK